MRLDYAPYYKLISSFQCSRALGKVSRVVGLIVEVTGIRPFIGEMCLVKGLPGQPPIPAEVVGFKDRRAMLMPLGPLSGVAPGSLVQPTGQPFRLTVGPELLGKVLDGLGRPLQGGKIEFKEPRDYLVENSPPNPLERRPIEEVLATSVKAIDALLTCGSGQRIGIFSGSGVGKSTLLGMIARYSEADVSVIGLVGERGREVGDFLQHDLGEEGLKRSVVVVSTSDRPALERVKAAYVATSIAEYFRDRGKRVILMMDSVTRFAMALREIGLAVGEPPATKGYTPSVFAALPRLLERSGTSSRGSITGFYTVLVEGDDLNEPIADAVRGILDGHIVLTRKLAAKNHFPAIDILNSNSRLMPYLVEEKHREKAAHLKELMAAYAEQEDLINIGAYVAGTNSLVDKAIAWRDKINAFLRQDLKEGFCWQETVEQLYGF